MIFLTLAVGLVIFLLLAAAAIQSLRENEPRAAGRTAMLSFLLSLPFFILAGVPFSHQNTAATVLLAAVVCVFAVLVVPTKKRRLEDNDTPMTRIDERDTMFSRHALVTGSEQANQYYEEKPENKEPDDAFRAKPGLLKTGSLYFDHCLFSSADASFASVEALHSLAEKEPDNEPRIRPNPKQMSEYIKQWGRKLGAVSVGVARLEAYHKYTIIGRGTRYGEPVDLDHLYAIALTVEMDKAMLDRAPRGPIVMESAQQYLASGAIAVQIADFIRRLGYPARAHIDANYRVVCPLVARDAGLGEIGRMGLLMTPELGPRVRIAVVTTDLPLLVDGRRRDDTMIDFCSRCKKCAEVCPSRAIPFGDRIDIDGAMRWQIDSESCFIYWCTVGTDCGRCVAVCPYSHPDTFMHNVVRSGVRNNALFRRLAVELDDFFYGKIPPPLPLPDWMTVCNEAGNNVKADDTP